MGLAPPAAGQVTVATRPRRLFGPRDALISACSWQTLTILERAIRDAAVGGTSLREQRAFRRQP